MRILADENVYEPIIEYLRSKGHAVASARDPSRSGGSDDDLYREAVREGWLIVTMDKDFMRTRRFPPSACGGIVLVKVYRRTVDVTTAIFRKHFEMLDEARIKGKLVILTADGIRTRG